MHVRKDDLVEVIAGDDAEPGRTHRVLRVPSISASTPSCSSSAR